MNQKLFLLGIFLTLYINIIKAQELFPNTEPASTIPKGTLGLRILNESYEEVNVLRNMTLIRLMYGLGSNFSIYLQASGSNHHSSKLPNNLFTHRHVGNQILYYTQNRNYGQKYPYSINGVNMFFKYRFLSIDSKNKHFRMALIGEVSKVRSAHDEAEPRLIDDCSGASIGLILTQLYKKIAFSFTSSFIKPLAYSEISDKSKIKLNYGEALSYDISIGYLLYPKIYKNYEQDNYNLYLELKGKTYTQASLFINDQSIEINNNAFRKGHYCEIYLGIQRIVNSNSRFDITIGFPVINRSYIRFYPIYNVGWTQFFYFNRTKSEQAIKQKLIKGKLKN